MVVKVIALAINNSRLLLFNPLRLHHFFIKKIKGTKDIITIEINTDGEIVPNKSRLKEKISTYFQVRKISSALKVVVETPIKNRIYSIQVSNPTANVDRKIRSILLMPNPNMIFALREIKTIGNIIIRNVGL